MELSKKKGKWFLGSQTDTDVRLSSPDFQDQPQKIPQLCPPERQLSRQGGFPTQRPARRLVGVRVDLKRDQNSGGRPSEKDRVQLVEWGRIIPSGHPHSPGQQPIDPGRSDKSHQARLPPVGPGRCSPSAPWAHTDPFMMLHGNRDGMHQEWSEEPLFSVEKNRPLVNVLLALCFSPRGPRCWVEAVNRKRARSFALCTPDGGQLQGMHQCRVCAGAESQWGEEPGIFLRQSPQRRNDGSSKGKQKRGSDEERDISKYVTDLQGWPNDFSLRGVQSAGPHTVARGKFQNPSISYNAAEAGQLLWRIRKLWGSRLQPQGATYLRTIPSPSTPPPALYPPPQAPMWLLLRPKGTLTAKMVPMRVKNSAAGASPLPSCRTFRCIRFLTCDVGTVTAPTALA